MIVSNLQENLRKSQDNQQLEKDSAITIAVK